MQHRLERPLGDFLLEDFAAAFIGFAGVDHQRQAGDARRRDMGPESPLLRRGRTVSVVIVEPRLAQRDHLRMLR